jgi:hypothetical protein
MTGCGSAGVGLQNAVCGNRRIRDEAAHGPRFLPALEAVQLEEMRFYSGSQFATIDGFQDGQTLGRPEIA